MSEEIYTTLAGEGVAEFEEKRSVFIGHAIPVKDEDAANEYIKKMKKEYADATHNVFGYSLKNGVIARYSDDGEPQGTAGMPVLETIRKSGATDALVVVTRYFGGILLGAGGLVRAYAKSAKLAIEQAGIVTYENFSIFRIRCNYSDYQKIGPLLSKSEVIVDGTEFGNEITVTAAVRENTLDSLCVKLSEITSARAAVERIGNRFDHIRKD